MTKAPEPSEATASPARDRLIDWLCLIAVLAFAIGLRISLTDPDPSVDEIWHLALSRGGGSPVGIYPADVAVVDAPPITTLDGAPPAWHVWTHMDGVLHPPLYVLTLRLWRDVFGESDAAGHALSLAWSAVFIGFCFEAMRLTAGRAAAIWATLLVAASPVQIYFAQEIRGYEMMIALGAIVLWVATRIEVSGQTPRRAAGLAALSLPLLLTHYFAAGGVIGIGVYGIVRLRGRSFWTFVSVATAAAAIYAIAWIPFALRQVSSLSTGDAFTRVPSVNWLREVPWAVAISSRLLMERPWISGTLRGGSAAAFGLALLALPWFRLRRVPAVLPWTCWLAGSIATLVALDAARTTWVVAIIRYGAIASPAVPLLAVALVRTYAPRVAVPVYLAGAIALLAFRPADAGLVADAPQFGDAAHWLARAIRPGEAILVIEGAAGSHATDLVLLTLGHEPGLFPRTLVKVTGPLTSATLALLPDRAWAVMVDRDEARAVAATRGLTLLRRERIVGVGVLELYDLSSARRVSATRPTS